MNKVCRKCGKEFQSLNKRSKVCGYCNKSPNNIYDVQKKFAKEKGDEHEK